MRLMLALDLFVVVVAVDARWLIRSLEHHHHELFERGDSGDDLGATPVDYLDKIFQIPFTLLPATPDATADYLRSLLPAPAHNPWREPVQLNPAPQDPAADDDGTAEPATDENRSAAEPAPPGRDITPAPGPDASDVPGRGEDAIRDHAPLDRNPDLLVRQAAAAEIVGAGVVELRPLGLQVTQAEVAFMARLDGRLPTPRVAKRPVNLYRLVRIGIPGAQLGEFVGDEAGGPYQAVQVLLAVLVGHPEFARKVFGLILGHDDGDSGTGGDLDLVAVVETVEGRGGNQHSFGIVRSSLIKIREEAPISVSMAECRRWCPHLARFSFYTRDLAGT